MEVVGVGAEALASERIFLSDLPRELKLEILERVDGFSRGNLYLVSREWRELIEPYIIFFPIFKIPKIGEENFISYESGDLSDECRKVCLSGDILSLHRCIYNSQDTISYALSKEQTPIINLISRTVCEGGCIPVFWYMYSHRLKMMAINLNRHAIRYRYSTYHVDVYSYLNSFINESLLGACRGGNRYLIEFLLLQNTYNPKLQSNLPEVVDALCQRGDLEMLKRLPLIKHEEADKAKQEDRALMTNIFYAACRYDQPHIALWWWLQNYACRGVYGFSFVDLKKGFKKACKNNSKEMMKFILMKFEDDGQRQNMLCGCGRTWHQHRSELGLSDA